MCQKMRAGEFLFLFYRVSLRHLPAVGRQLLVAGRLQPCQSDTVTTLEFLFLFLFYFIDLVIEV
jgi:hypothetical protein